MSLEMDEDSVKSEKSCGSSAISVTPFSINDILNCAKPKEGGCDVQERALDMSKKWNQSRGRFIRVEKDVYLLDRNSNIKNLKFIFKLLFFNLDTKHFKNKSINLLIRQKVYKKMC